MDHRHRSPRRLARLFVLALGAATLADAAAAQLRAPGRTVSERTALAGEVPRSVMPPIDALAYLAEDERNGSSPLRYGALIPTAIGIETGGVLDVAPDGSVVWRARIDSPGAFSIGLEFDEFDLPEGAQLFVYDPGRTTTLGAYTSRNNKANGEFQVEPLAGDAAVLEYVQPAGVTEMPRLRVGRVIHDYRDILQLHTAGEAGAGGGGNCLIDINCPTASAYQDEKRAVARILAGGALCTGALLNNTAEDERQLFLSANHCGGMGNAIFTFNFEHSGCESGFAPLNQTVQGSVLLATSDVQDYRLIEITENIPASFNPYYAGWKRTAGAPNSTISISHPGGGPKKFTRDTNSPFKSDPFWATVWSEGMIEGGSSGGPLFNGNGLVMGPACCVSNFVCGQQTSFYGRMELFWSAVAPYLDPLGLAPGTFPGSDGEVPDPPTLAITSISPDTVPAVVVDGPQVVDVFGEDFFTVTGVSVDGVDLENFPPQYAVLSGSHLQILEWPELASTGPVDVVLAAGATTVATSVDVVLNDPPVINLVGSQSEGGFLFGAVGLDVTMGSGPGDVHFLSFSGSTNPSSLPGFVDWGIGNNFFNLYGLGTYVIPSQGWFNLVLPVSGSLGGVIVHVQSAVFEVGSPDVFPLTMSNVQSGQFLF